MMTRLLIVGALAALVVTSGCGSGGASMSMSGSAGDNGRADASGTAGGGAAGASGTAGGGAAGASGTAGGGAAGASDTAGG
ncbi:MAG TPA: hypothetical protein VLA14_12660, partial [Polyangia bacterium]|nr:hypothetical protein [Polyangia bacterium]